LDYNNWYLQEVVKNKLKKLMSLNKNYTEKEIFELSVSLTEQQNKHISTLSELIAAEPVVKIISTFMIKKESIKNDYSSEPRIVAYTTVNPEQKSEKIYNLLKVSPGVNLVKFMSEK